MAIQKPEEMTFREALEVGWRAAVLAAGNASRTDEAVNSMQAARVIREYLAGHEAAQEPNKP